MLSLLTLLPILLLVHPTISEDEFDVHTYVIYRFINMTESDCDKVHADAFSALSTMQVIIKDNYLDAALLPSLDLFQLTINKLNGHNVEENNFQIEWLYDLIDPDTGLREMYAKSTIDHTIEHQQYLYAATLDPPFWDSNTVSFRDYFNNPYINFTVANASDITWTQDYDKGDTGWLTTFVVTIFIIVLLGFGVFAVRFYLSKRHSKRDDIKMTSFGYMQSPIDIISTTECGKTKIMNDDEFKLNPLTFNYPSSMTGCTILNNGHTVQINIAKKCTVSINQKTYDLKQFHFHTPSEHLVDGKQYEMEMHLVHINSAGEIAVLGFIFTTAQKRSKHKLKYTKSRKHVVLSDNKGDGAEEKKEEDDEFDTDEDWDPVDDKNTGNKYEKYKDMEKGNDFLAQFWSELPVEKTEKDIPLEKALSFDYLFETSSNNFVRTVSTHQIDIDMEIFEYVGSLTTPPYTEGVQWLVSKTTHFISKRQLFKLSACWGHHSNARPVQEMFGRTVSVRNTSGFDLMSEAK